MIAHFRRDRLPPARTFYERELGKLSRPDRNGWAKANCCFHKSKSRTSFSANVENGAFFCHGCGVKGGDVLAFVRQRDGLSFKEAAQRLGAWDEAPSPDTVRKLAEQDRERDRQREAEQTRQSEGRRQRLELREELLADVHLYNVISGELAGDPDNETLWHSLALARECRELSDRAYCQVAGLEYSE